MGDDAAYGRSTGLLQGTLGSQWLTCASFCPMSRSPIKMGDGEAPVAAEFKYLGSMLSKNFDDSVTIMARIRLARIHSTHEAAKGYFRDEARCA